jgi:3,4-dihydroxy 2-butanone 4-phosphate synthase/GTP cyclohydrolase II
MARLPQLVEFARKHNLKIITIAHLIEYRLRTERLVHRGATATLPTEFGQFQVYGYRDTLNQVEHLALVKGDPTQFAAEPVLVRVQAECPLGDALGSLRCDCRRQLTAALKMIDHQGKGVLVYLRRPELSLIEQIQSYARQDLGLAETVPAGAMDLRDYGIGAQILRDVGVRKMRLISNTSRHISGLRGFGLEVAERVPLLVEESDLSLQMEPSCSLTGKFEPQLHSGLGR